MTETERIYQLMVLTAWSDGQLHEREQAMAGQLLNDVPELRQVVSREDLARSALDLLRASGVRAAAAEIASGITDPGSRRLAVTCCAHVLAADGRLAAEEFAVVSELRQQFGLTIDEVKRILAIATRR